MASAKQVMDAGIKVGLDRFLLLHPLLPHFPHRLHRPLPHRNPRPFPLGTLRDHHLPRPIPAEKLKNLGTIENKYLMSYFVTIVMITGGAQSGYQNDKNHQSHNDPCQPGG